MTNRREGQARGARAVVASSFCLVRFAQVPGCLIRFVTRSKRAARLTPARPCWPMLVQQLEIINSNSEPKVTFEDGRKALIIANAAYESYKNKKIVDINYD